MLLLAVHIMAWAFPLTQHIGVITLKNLINENAALFDIERVLKFKYADGYMGIQHVVDLVTLAANLGRVDVIKMCWVHFLPDGSSLKIEHLRQNKNAILCNAVEGGHVNVLEYLLRRQSRIYGRFNICDFEDVLHSAIGKAASQGHVSVLEFLIKCECLVNYVVIKKLDPQKFLRRKCFANAVDNGHLHFARVWFDFVAKSGLCDRSMKRDLLNKLVSSHIVKENKDYCDVLNELWTNDDTLQIGDLKTVMCKNRLNVSVKEVQFFMSCERDGRRLSMDFLKEFRNFGCCSLLERFIDSLTDVLFDPAEYTCGAALYLKNPKPSNIPNIQTPENISNISNIQKPLFEGSSILIEEGHGVIAEIGKKWMVVCVNGVKDVPVRLA